MTAFIIVVHCKSCGKMFWLPKCKMQGRALAASGGSVGLLHRFVITKRWFDIGKEELVESGG